MEFELLDEVLRIAVIEEPELTGGRGFETGREVAEEVELVQAQGEHAIGAFSDESVDEVQALERSGGGGGTEFGREALEDLGHVRLTRWRPSVREDLSR